MCTRYFPKPKCIRSCIKTSTKDNVLILLTQMEKSYINGLETKTYKHGKKKSICHAISLFALCRFPVGAN